MAIHSSSLTLQQSRSYQASTGGKMLRKAMRFACKRKGLLAGNRVNKKKNEKLVNICRYFGFNNE